LILARVRAESRRLLTQGPVWSFAAVLGGAAAWAARWSPGIVDVSQSGPAQLTVSVAGATEIASIQIATGLGVAFAAVFSAAGPGRDFVDGGAEVQRARGTAAGRFVGRAVSVSLLTIGGGVAITAAYVLGGLAISAQDGFAFALRSGDWRVPHVLAGVVCACAQATWVVALSYRLRTQAAQLALPLALAIAMFLVSRLSPYPVTPDSWLGPLLGLHAQRAMVDYWWSVGGDVRAPWGDAALLAAAVGGAAAVAIRSDRRLG
jgi:hypothetical protein